MKNILSLAVLLFLSTFTFAQTKEYMTILFDHPENNQNDARIVILEPNKEPEFILLDKGMRKFEDVLKTEQKINEVINQYAAKNWVLVQSSWSIHSPGAGNPKDALHYREYVMEREKK